MTDEDIRGIFFSKTGKFNRAAKSLLETNDEIISYLSNRYTDSESLIESVYRIQYNWEERPKCLICGNPVEFRYGPNILKGQNFKRCCSKECRNKLRAQNKDKAILEKYGVTNVYAHPDIINKIRENLVTKYGGYTLQSPVLKERVVKTCLDKYGVENPFSSEVVKEKIRKTNLQKYGAENPFGSKEIISKLDYTLQCKHAYETKKKKHCFGSSMEEERCYELLCSKYLNVERQYSSKEYPFNCDFYIHDIDTYIEYNGYFTHGDHPYDPLNKDDADKLSFLLEKAKEHTQYATYIDVWTKRDPLKRNTAKQNNLNYIEFWHVNELEEWLMLS